MNSFRPLMYFTLVFTLSLGHSYAAFGSHTFPSTSPTPTPPPQHAAPPKKVKPKKESKFKNWKPPVHKEVPAYEEQEEEEQVTK